MDGYLATYTALAILFMTRYLHFSEDSQDLWIAILCLGICTGFKNEGMVLTAIIGVVYLKAVFSGSKLKNREEFVSLLAPLLVAFMPILIWRIWCFKNGIGNDLTVEGWSDRLISRVQNIESIKLIIIYVFGDYLFLQTLYFLLAWSLFGGFKQVLRGFGVIIEPVAVLSIYMATIIFIYLTTYWDLQEHLNSSASRVILPLTCIILCLPFILINFEYLSEFDKP